jgi:hypothetical protein
MAWSSRAAHDVASQPTDHARVRPREPLIAVQREDQHHARASIAEAADGVHVVREEPQRGPGSLRDSDSAPDQSAVGLATRVLKAEGAQRAFELGYTCSDALEVVTGERSRIGVRATTVAVRRPVRRSGHVPPSRLPGVVKSPGEVARLQTTRRNRSGLVVEARGSVRFFASCRAPGASGQAPARRTSHRSHVRSATSIRSRT